MGSSWTRTWVGIVILGLMGGTLTGCAGTVSGQGAIRIASLTTPTATAPVVTQPTLTYEGHNGAVVAAAWSPDGKQIASGGDDGTVQVWDSATGKEQWSFTARCTCKTAFVWAVAWSPDGKRIAAGGFDGNIAILDAASGQTLATYEGTGAFIQGVGWSPDGQKIAWGANDGTVQIWNVATGKPVQTCTGPTGPVERISWSPNGGRIAVASDDGSVTICDATTGQTVVTHPQGAAVWSVAWSPDGEKIVSGAGAAGQDNPLRAKCSVQVWDATTGKTLLTYTGHGGDGNVYALAWSPDSKRIASGADDNTIRVWNAATGQTAVVLHGHRDAVWTVMWAPDGGRLLSASQDGSVAVWAVPAA